MSSHSSPLVAPVVCVSWFRSVKNPDSRTGFLIITPTVNFPVKKHIFYLVQVAGSSLLQCKWISRPWLDRKLLQASELEDSPK